MTDEIITETVAAEPTKAGWGASVLNTQLATVGVVVVGAALFEAALIPGIVVGAATALLAPKVVPVLSAKVPPLAQRVVCSVSGLIRKKKATETVAPEVVAETHAEPTVDGAVPAAA